MIWGLIGLTATMLLIALIGGVIGYYIGRDERDFWKEQYERELFFGRARDEE